MKKMRGLAAVALSAALLICRPAWTAADDEYYYDEDDYYYGDDYYGDEEWNDNLDGEWDDGLDDWTDEDGEWDGEASAGTDSGVHLGPSSDELSEKTGRDISGIEASLGSLPGSYDGLAEAGVVIAGEDGLVNAGRFESFISSVLEGAGATVRIASFTDEGAAVISYVDYDGYNFVCVRDNTRDHYYLGSAYVVRSYSYLLGFSGGENCAVLGSGMEENYLPAGEWGGAALANSAYGSISEVRDAVYEEADSERIPAILFEGM